MGGTAAESSCRRTTRRNAGRKNYDENMIDEIMESHLGSVPKKRNRTVADLQKETELEAMIALSLGFPIDALLDEEIRAGVVSELGGREQNDYIVVRNHILCMWRDNVGKYLHKNEIMESVSNEYEGMVRKAYEFLLSNGYINFGVSTSIKAEIPKEATMGSVIVIGSGLAGLAAARQLLSFGFKVVVLEGRKRPGGRVYTKKIGRRGRFGAADLGGSIITGIHANPLGVLARQLSLPLHKVRDKCPLYRPDGSPLDEETDSKIEFIFNRLLDKATQLRQTIGAESAAGISLGSALETFRQLYSVALNVDERQLLDWHLANLEFSNAGLLPQLSLAFWDQDDPYEMGGDHCFLAGGNGRLIDAMCDNVPIFYGKTVDTIKYDSHGVEVIAGGQAFQADMVICTVPLGVLKRRSITFSPELPKRKLDAIDRLGFGLLNKVAMIFPHVFWGEELDTFGCINDDSSRRGEFYLFYCCHMVSGAPVIIALVAGEAAITFESTDPTHSLHRVLSVLRGIYSPRGIEVPNPIQTICTRWGSDPLSCGSYSHVRVGSSGDDYDILAENVGDGRLFFAGEATSRQYPATMHGAFLSGLREASHVLMAARSRQTAVMKSIPRYSQLSEDILVDLFKKPDRTVGKFSFIFDPRTDDPNSMGLMRISFGENHDVCDTKNVGEGENVRIQCSSKLQLHLYAAISKGKADDLKLVSGSNENKLIYLHKNIGLKLMGSRGLGASGNCLVASIAGARKSSGRSSCSSVKT
ncbi:lysine-specific histone demethylase 1 homolog 2-like [Nymphaea colorata]|nr:lysine-specific histone demethylase 1 homolog 2-like [Nymphaea colorata]